MTIVPALPGITRSATAANAVPGASAPSRSGQRPPGTSESTQGTGRPKRDPGRKLETETGSERERGKEREKSEQEKKENLPRTELLDTKKCKEKTLLYLSELFISNKNRILYTCLPNLIVNFKNLFQLILIHVPCMQTVNSSTIMIS